MSQQSIKVDAGTGSAVDFSQTSGGNFRQVVSIGDPNTDANYANVNNGSVTVSFNHPIPAGSNIIGSVQMTNSLPAGSSVVGSVSMSGGGHDSTDVIYNGPVAITPSFGTIGFSGLGNNVVVGTITNKRIRVVAMSFIVGTATNVYIQDSASVFLWGASSITGQFAANAGIVLPYCPFGYFQTGSGNALMMNISASSSVAGSLTYLTV